MHSQNDGLLASSCYNQDDMEILDSFLSYLLSVKGESENTKCAYENDIRQYLSYLERLDLEVFDVSPSDAREYVRTLMEGYKERSMLRKLSALRMFYDYLMRKGVIDFNPFEDISLKRMSPIAEVLEHPGIRAFLVARFAIEEHFYVDVVPSPVIVPDEIEKSIPSMFDDEPISVMAYLTETVIAEKLALRDLA